jgi:hypothetical protein
VQIKKTFIYANLRHEISTFDSSLSFLPQTVWCAVMRTNFNPSTRSRRGWRNAGLDADVLYICRRVQYMSPCSCRIVSDSDLPYFRFRAPEIAGDIRFRYSFIQFLQNRKCTLGGTTRSIRWGTLLLHTCWSQCHASGSSNKTVFDTTVYSMR